MAAASAFAAGLVDLKRAFCSVFLFLRLLMDLRIGIPLTVTVLAWNFFFAERASASELTLPFLN